MHLLLPGAQVKWLSSVTRPKPGCEAFGSSAKNHSVLYPQMGHLSILRTRLCTGLRGSLGKLTKLVERVFSEKTQSGVSLSLVRSVLLPISLTHLLVREGGLGSCFGFSFWRKWSATSGSRC